MTCQVARPKTTGPFVFDDAQLSGELRSVRVRGWGEGGFARDVMCPRLQGWRWLYPQTARPTKHGAIEGPGNPRQVQSPPVPWVCLPYTRAIWTVISLALPPMPNLFPP
jgi:hypothetical protein